MPIQLNDLNYMIIAFIIIVITVLQVLCSNDARINSWTSCESLTQLFILTRFKIDEG